MDLKKNKHQIVCEEMDLKSEEITNKEDKKLTVKDIETIKQIGKGSFATVQLVKQNEKIQAMKTIKKERVSDEKHKTRTSLERDLLAGNQHPFLLSLDFAFQSERKLYLITEQCLGGDLFTLLKRESQLKENRARVYLAQILLAIEHLHSNNIVQRDLKPENVLIAADGQLKVADFGLGKHLGTADVTQSRVGTAEQMAPELAQGKQHGYEVDQFSFGCLMYEMMAGDPIKDTSKLVFPKGKRAFSRDAEDIVRRLLRKDPEDRLGREGIDQVKLHPFFKKTNWDDIYNKKLVPAFKPVVTDSDITQYFDKSMTSTKISSSVEEHSIDAEYQENWDYFKD